MPSTPSTPTAVEADFLPTTPPAPKFGYSDSWEPYRPRKSARVAASQSKRAVESLPTPPSTKPKARSTRPAEMPLTPKKTPRKPAKKVSGSTLESFKAENVDEDFDIFNDSCNRVPKKESNLFFNPPTEATSSQKPRNKSKQVCIPGEGMKNVEEAVGREDGMVFNFRGKTYFRHFESPANEEAKPKVLWPKKTVENNDAIFDEEEATTDVEDNLSDTDSLPATPVRKGKTPNAPRLPASPPTTQRTTRSTDKLSGAPAPSARGGRTQGLLKFGAVAKSSKSSVVPAKRAAESPVDGPAKRIQPSTGGN